MVDQELSLFHDTAPMLAVSDLCAPLPGPEELWMSGNADQWMAAMQSNINHSANVSAQLLAPPSLTPSLFALFQDFLHDNLDSQRWGVLTPSSPQAAPASLTVAVVAPTGGHILSFRYVEPEGDGSKACG